MEKKFRFENNFEIKLDLLFKFFEKIEVLNLEVDRELLIFVVSGNIKDAKKALRLWVDATFKIVRFVNGFYQCLCVFYQHFKGDKSMGAPIAFALLKDKSERTYELAFSRIKS